MITYGELNERAALLAGRLKELGVDQDAPVAIVLPRSPEMIISILAVLKAGGFYLPIDAGLPEERKKYMISDSGCRVILMGAGPESISVRRNGEGLRASRFPMTSPMSSTHPARPADPKGSW